MRQELQGSYELCLQAAWSVAVYVIGHRGAAGLELENTSSSMQRAMSLGVSAIEIDIRVSSDGQLVVCHDADLERIAGKNIKIEETTLKKLKAIKLHDGSNLLTLEEALKLASNITLIIEVKDGGYEDRLVSILDKFPDHNLIVTSFNHQFLLNLKSLRPDAKIYLAERTRPLEILKLAHDAHAKGVNLNAWLLNPLTYWLARFYQLDIMVYTVNYVWLARFIHLLYPRARICTDFPDRFVRRKRLNPFTKKVI